MKALKGELMGNPFYALSGGCRSCGNIHGKSSPLQNTSEPGCSCLFSLDPGLVFLPTSYVELEKGEKLAGA